MSVEPLDAAYGERSFGTLLRHSRLAADLTQATLAGLAGISIRCIQQLERELSQPQRQTVERLAEALGLTAEQQSVFRDAAKPVARRRLWAIPEVCESGPAPTRPLQLPELPGQLFGREQEVAEVRGLLRREDVRLVTVTGTGGTGKTRLAIHIAASLVPEFTHGACFVDLASVGDSKLVEPAIAQALGLRDNGQLPLKEQLHGYLRERRILLVLDNLEHLLPAAPAIAALLSMCPHIKVLATSRSPLYLRWEHVSELPPLGVPQLDRLPMVEDLAQVPSVALFIDRARSHAPAFALTADNARDVAEVCVRLDGLPLALELAAARTGVLTPAAMLRRLERRLELLSVGLRDQPARHQTLRAALSWSFELLAEPERKLFRRLGVFAGGATLDTIVSMSSERQHFASGDASALNSLTLLVDNSLVQRRHAGDDRPRFGMLETVREYALEQLRESGEADDVQTWYVRHFVAVAEAAHTDWFHAGSLATFKQLEAELPNLRDVLRLVRSRGEVETGVRMVAALWRFWWLHGLLIEAQEWIDWALGVSVYVSPPLRARIVSTAGSYYIWKRGHLARASELHERSLAMYRELDDAAGTARSLHNLAVIRRYQGDYHGAAALYEESLVLWRRLGDVWGIATTVANLGLTRWLQGELDAAQSLHDESLVLYRQLDHRWGIAHALHNLGLVAQERRDWQRAETLFVQALELRRDGDRFSIPASLQGLARTAAATGLWQRAAQLFGAAKSLSDAIDALPPIGGGAWLAVTRSSLGQAAFVEAWNRGEEMSLDEAVEAALKSDPVGDTTPLDPLTPRERELAELVAGGFTNRQIAEALVISPRTVENHVTHILNKLGLGSRTDVAVWVVRRDEHK